MRSKKIALVLALVAICLFAYMAAVLPVRADMPHDCCGEDCFVCLCSSLFERLAGALVFLAAVCVVALLLLDSKNKACCAADASFAAQTPIRLKVKLSN